MESKAPFLNYYFQQGLHFILISLNNAFYKLVSERKIRGLPILVKINYAVVTKPKLYRDQNAPSIFGNGSYPLIIGLPK